MLFFFKGGRNSRSDSDIMFTVIKNKKKSLDNICTVKETADLRTQVEILRKKTRQLESEKLLRAAETASDFTYGQMDRVITNVRNFNYGMDKLESAVDSIRRYDALCEKKGYEPKDVRREAVSVIFLSMDHYVDRKNRVSENIAVQELIELTGRINKYFEMRCRPADCFSKGGWQDHKFMFVLPATDKAGAKIFLDRVIKNSCAYYDNSVSISFGVANYAADVSELSSKEPSKAVASRLLDAARHIARHNSCDYSGRINFD